ncbi:MAG: glycosyltransferase family 4 protein [Terriglobales bacterium]
MAGSAKVVHVLLWTGKFDDAQRVAGLHYPDCRLHLLPRRELRENGWKGQMRSLRRLEGEALVFFFQALEDAPEPQLLACTGLLHRCRTTVLADATGGYRVSTRWGLAWLLPRILASGLSDLAVLLATRLLLWILFRVVRPAKRRDGNHSPLDLAYLYAYPAGRIEEGGASSHISGFLVGLAEESSRVEIFSACPLPKTSFPATLILPKRRLYLFREGLVLWHNFRFAKAVYRALSQRRPRALYQRHRKFLFAGALLSLLLRTPLVLEYNGSEVWVAQHWDPSRFGSWLAICEEVSLKAAALIVAVSEPLRDELIRRGVPGERILVNPNGVDPHLFHPDCGGKEVRARLGFEPHDVVVGFVGTFSYWHGVAVLQDAILQILSENAASGELPRIRFLLVGQGLLHAEMRQALCRYEERGDVLLPGRVPHDRVAAYLDACDILWSPHTTMPDRTPFFGSPTKLFEYMGVGKAIVASNLDQLGRVLRHNQTAWLVPPDHPQELAEAIRLLARQPALRQRLGSNAAADAEQHYTWRHNAKRVLARVAGLAEANRKAGRWGVQQGNLG